MDDAAIWRKHKEELIRYATVLVGVDHAEDVLSTVVERVLRSRGSLTTLDDARSYLFRAVLNESRGRIRRRRIIPWERDFVEDQIGFRPDVAAAVGSLPERQRAAVYLTYWRDLPIGEVIPYLDMLGHEASDTGLPLMRPLALEYPEQPELVGVADQFLLGENILVAPVLEPGTKNRNVYIPDGDWFDLWTGIRVNPGRHEIYAPPDSIPVFVRGGAAIPLWLGEELELGSKVGLPASDTGRLVVMIFPGDGSTLIRDPLSGETLTVVVGVVDNQLAITSVGGSTLDVWTRIRPGSNNEQTTRRLHPAQTLSVDLQ